MSYLFQISFFLQLIESKHLFWLGNLHLLNFLLILCVKGYLFSFLLSLVSGVHWLILANTSAYRTLSLVSFLDHVWSISWLHLHTVTFIFWILGTFTHLFKIFICFLNSVDWLVLWLTLYHWSTLLLWRNRRVDSLLHCLLGSFILNICFLWTLLLLPKSSWKFKVSSIWRILGECASDIKWSFLLFALFTCLSIVIHELIVWSQRNRIGIMPAI